VRPVVARDVKKLRKNTQFHEYFNISFEKVSEYLTRKSNVDLQNRYLIANEEGKASLVEMRQLKEVVDKVIQLSLGLNKM
jgi:pimeloyl-CoA synthetase